jgi:tetratricopeptide (TPR) repeat protein
MTARTWTLMFLIAGAGCVQVPSTTTSHAPPNVKLTGACIELDDGAKPMPEVFAARVEELQKAHRNRQAAALLARYPDVALQCGDKIPGFAFSTYQVRYAEIEKELAACKLEEEKGHDKSAVAHWQLAFAQFLQGAAGTDPNQVVTSIPANPSAQPPCDPNLAERIASVRPEIAPWPGAAIASALAADLVRAEVLETRFDSAKSIVSCESAFWLTVGHWRLERHEPKGALAALKKAESADATGIARPWIQIQQAKAFLQLGQSATAVSVLTGVTGSPNAKLAAMATLGACKFKDGHTEQALVLLKKAIEEWPTPFPCRAESEADLALAYLSVGDEMTGLGHLHAAQKDLQSAGRRPSLWTALENEARYLRHVGKLDDATKVEARLAADQTH